MPIQQINRGEKLKPVRMIWDEPGEYDPPEQPLMVTPYGGGATIENHESSICLTIAQSRLLAKVLLEIVRESKE